MKKILDEIKRFAGDKNSTIFVKDILSSVAADKVKKIRPEVLSLLVEAARFLSEDNDTGVTYKPAEDYSGLLSQFKSLTQLNRSLQQQVAFYRRNVGNEQSNMQEIARLHEEIDSERAANEQLTKENSDLRQALLERDKRLSALEVNAMAHEHASRSFPSQQDAAVRRADEAELRLQQEQESNRLLKNENKRLGLVEHLMKKTAGVLSLQHTDDPFLAQDVFSHTVTLMWNFEQITRELKAGMVLPEPLHIARILPLPESRLATERVEMVVGAAVKMLSHAEIHGYSAASECATDLHRKMSDGDISGAMYAMASALQHNWPITASNHAEEVR